uniref:Nuclear cap-binding protein subunit 1 n=2 Tax=Schistosoma japonicum TaxID=6182 RepID=C1LEH3_SCHJA|nr:Nuclear cap-binding protein subunit 1 [Schistosoma japonicum]
MRRRRRSDSFDDDDFRFKRDRTEPDTIESLIYRIGFKDLSNIERDIGELASVILADIPKNGESLLKVLSNCVKNVPERILIYATLVGLLNLKNRSFVGQLIELLQRDLKDAIRSASFEDAKYIVLFLSISVNCYTVQQASILGLYENFAEVTLDAGRSSQSRTDWYTYTILYGLPYSGHLLAAHDPSALNDILGTLEVYMAKRQCPHVSLLRVWESDDPHPQEDYLDCLWAQICNLRNGGWVEKVTWRLYDSFPSLKEHGQPHKLSPLTPPDYDAEVIYPLPSVIFRMFDYTDVIDQDESEIVPGSELLPDGGAKFSKEAPVLPGAHTIERFLIDEHLAILMNNLSFNRVMCAKALLGLKTRAKVALDYMIIEAVFAGMFHLPRPPVQHGNLLFYGSLLIQLCHEASNTIPLVLAQATEVLFERLDNMKPVCIGRFIEWFSYHLSNYQLQWSWKEWSSSLTLDPMSPQKRLITETLCRLIRFSYFENVKRLLPKSFYILLPPQPTVINKYESNPDLPSARAFFRLVDSIRARLEPQTVLRIAETASQSRGRRRSISEPFDNDGVIRDNEEKDEDDESSDDSHSDHSDVERRGKSPIDTIPLSDPEFDELNDSEPAKQDIRARLKARRRILRESAMKRKLKMLSEDNIDEEMDTKDDSIEKLPFNTTQAPELSPGVTNLAIELFYSAMLISGHKTISHTFAFIKKYAAVIRTLTSTVEAQVEALHVIQAVWANNPQMIVIITEHMCRVGLIDPEAVVRWAYSPIMTTLTDDSVNLNSANARPKILDFYVWECLSRTLIRVGRRVARITGRLELAKETMELDRRRSPYCTPDQDDADHGGLDGNNGFFKKPKDSISGRLKIRDRRRLMAGCELVSSSDDEAYGGGKDNVSGRVARLEEARCEAVRSQCAVITLLLHRHARLTAELAAEMSGSTTNNSLNTDSAFFLHETTQPTSLSDEALRNIMFWLKGRLVQVVLEHCDQLIPYLDNLDEFICGAHPEVQDVFQQLRSLYA